MCTPHACLLINSMYYCGFCLPRLHKTPPCSSSIYWLPVTKTCRHFSAYLAYLLRTFASFDDLCILETSCAFGFSSNSYFLPSGCGYILIAFYRQRFLGPSLQYCYLPSSFSNSNMFFLDDLNCFNSFSNYLIPNSSQSLVLTRD